MVWICKIQYSYHKWFGPNTDYRDKSIPAYRYKLAQKIYGWNLPTGTN